MRREQRTNIREDSIRSMTGRIEMALTDRPFISYIVKLVYLSSIIYLVRYGRQKHPIGALGYHHSELRTLTRALSHDSQRAWIESTRADIIARTGTSLKYNCT
jgi:hypothetical protein